LNAAEYIAVAGNQKIIFCLRGMKSEFAYPHRNLSDFSHVPVIKRLTKMPVCIDPSHATGIADRDIHGMPDLMHLNAQGIIAGANLLLIDIHPNPETALVDANQALSFPEFSRCLQDIAITRECYLRRIAVMPTDRT
jgi:3-deoxy-7-phosphoheptulonate synthase